MNDNNATTNVSEDPEETIYPTSQPRGPIALNLDRLHWRWGCKPPGRGQTTDMLVAALQRADFDVSDIVIVCRNKHHACVLMSMMLRIAQGMEYEKITIYPARLEAQILNTTFRFTGEDGLEAAALGRCCEFFVDEDVSTRVLGEMDLSQYGTL